jgi:hypothetical protein
MMCRCRIQDKKARSANQSVALSGERIDAVFCGKSAITGSTAQLPAGNFTAMDSILICGRSERFPQ